MSPLSAPEEGTRDLCSERPSSAEPAAPHQTLRETETLQNQSVLGEQGWRTLPVRGQMGNSLGFVTCTRSVWHRPLWTLLRGREQGSPRAEVQGPQCSWLPQLVECVEELAREKTSKWRVPGAQPPGSASSSPRLSLFPPLARPHSAGSEAMAEVPFLLEQFSLLRVSNTHCCECLLHADLG